MSVFRVAVAVGVLATVAGGGVLVMQLGREAPKPTEEPEARVDPAPVRAAPARAARDDWGDDERPDRGGEWGGRGPDMSRFDLDGDGELSDEERQRMREAMRAEWEARMDRDGDGVVSDEERRLARREAMLSNPMGRQFAMRFDADGDGKLDESEWEAMGEWRRQQEQERLDRMVAQFDMDGDGELSEDEEFIAREAQRAQWEQAREDFTQRYDADGDGRLSREERSRGFEEIRAVMERQQFRSRYDADSSGKVDNADFERFMREYNDGVLTSDVNNDGVLDQFDVQLFRDMMINFEIDSDLPEMDLPFGSGGFGGRRGGFGGGGRRGGGGGDQGRSDD